jgi:hypothetical protein
MKSSKQVGRFRVGDWGRIPIGSGAMVGEVIEDRGPIGVGGRRLVRISVPIQFADPMIVEHAESDIEPELRPAPSASTP